MIVRRLLLFSFVILLAGCGPTDMEEKYWRMKTQMQALSSYCGSDVKLKLVRKASNANIAFECSPLELKKNIDSLKDELSGQGYVLVVEGKEVNTWCKEGGSLHVQINTGLRISSYYPASVCH